jgi:methylated-DNA-[protein]-cysteine S-methyltransferase
VGGACRRNPVPIVVPCHRVIAAGGGVGGFMGQREGDALSIKMWLLDHERRDP